MEDYKKLLPYCRTHRQHEVISALNNYPSIRAAAHDMGVSRGGIQELIRSVKRNASMRGFAPDNDMTRPAPDGYIVKGTSTYYNADGQPTSQWVKTDIDRDRQRLMMLEAISEACKTVKREKPVKLTKPSNDDLLNLFVITDYHFGMLSWGEETGADWDANIAEELLVKWFAAAIDAAPAADTAVFAQLGDFLHFDGLESVTPTSAHILDADTRFARLVRASIRVLRRVTKMLLAKHQNLHIIMAEGNHDIASSVWLREIFSALYENEPRVIVDNSPDPYYAIAHGETSLFFHHGHKRKPTNIDGVFAAKFRGMFGNTKHSYAHMGHMHHVKAIESSLMVVEQHRTLSAPDAYASRGGWLSGRDAKVITYSKRFGEVYRATINPEMLEEKA